MKKTIAIIGAGGFGTCLAILLALLGHEVTLYERNGGIVKNCQEKRRNKRYAWLAKLKLPPNLVIELLPATLPPADFTIIATATAGLVDALRRATNPTTIVLIQKGLLKVEHPKAGRPNWTTPYDLAKGIVKRMPVLTFTGASFAWNLLGRTKVKMLIGYESANKPRAEDFADLFKGSAVWPVLCDDPTDAQVLGAIRVAASVAAGIFTGVIGEDNEATISVGKAEIFAEASRWASSDTFGIPNFPGDQLWRVFLADFLLCLRKESRNFNLGWLIAHSGVKKAQKRAQKLGTAEAIWTVGIIHDAVSSSLNLGSMSELFPYLHCLNMVLSEKMSVAQAHDFILKRQLR